MSERRPHAVLIVAAALLLLPLLYIGSYYALVQRSNQTERTTDNERIYLPKYRLGGRVAVGLFRPLYIADRNLRSETWTLEWEGDFPQ